ncbi:MAG: histidine kinase dimerization/phospho-acceptor domain-containing protein, partial [Pseudomonadota bacterium]
MTALPREIVDHLQAEYVSESRPCCFLLDESHRLKAHWGDTSWCGLGELSVGQDMLDAAPFLIGTLEATPQRLAFITTSDDIALHLVTIPQDQGHYVVLLDAGAEHRALQVSQQSANELRLLHAGQSRLIARQRELIAELVETKAELDHRRRDLERSSAGKSRFIAMMSHEFRTPLASIVNYSDLALEQDAPLEVVRKSVEAIARSSRHLSTLVDTILDEARLDAGQVIIRPRSFNLHDMLDDLAAMMAPLAAEKGLSYATHVEPDVPQQLVADDVCLRQILINLLGNAVKFTVEGGIRLYITHTDGRLVST